MNIVLSLVLAGFGIYWFDGLLGQSFAVFCGIVYFCGSWFYDSLIKARKEARRRREEAAKAAETAMEWKKKVLKGEAD